MDPHKFCSRLSSFCQLFVFFLWKTAAHCLYDIDIKSISVLLGVKEMDDNSSEMTTISATSWKLNPSFNKRSVLDDIGMIRLSRPAPGLFKPIAVRFSEGFPKQGKWTKVMGFGYTSGNGPRSNKLRQISLQVRKSKDCDRIFSSFNNARQICAGEDGKVRHSDKHRFSWVAMDAIPSNTIDLFI